jgi:alkylation response protein AidB-like acyl-CoA dehydrogenase
MDFSFSQEQDAVRELARRIFADRTDHGHLRDLEATGEWYDGALWEELAKANVPGIALPEELGGSGFGMLEVCIVLEEMGRHLAPVPLLPTLVLGGLPIAEFGSDAQRQRWLVPAARGEMVLSAALNETGSADPARPRVEARRDGTGWRLEGVKECVPAAQLAGCILVPARTGPDAVGVFLVDPAAPGVEIERQATINREPWGRLRLSGAAIDAEEVLGRPEDGAELIEWIVARAHVALAATQLGVSEEALRRTAEYVSQRKQFGRTIATFQSVALRAADAFIDVQCMRASLTQAAWLLSADRPASAEIGAAKWWACCGGQRVAHTAQHLHGGIGSDVDYPIHRFFLWSKQLQITLGGANQSLARLGRILVDEGRAEA